MTVRQDAEAMSGELAALRHRLHQEPEVGLALPRTQAKVLAALDDLPLEISTGQAATSVTAVLRGTARTNHGTVLLRADMDALPVHERSDLPFRSRFGDAMHACGHDLHTTMLVGAARLLCARRDRLAGDVVLMFQPGEEGYDGASVMVQEGVLDAAGRRADAAFAMHVFAAGQPGGRFVTRRGPIMAASDKLDVVVHGSGGHGSTPYMAKDPVVVVAEMVTAVQTMVTRQFSVFDPAVVSVGSLHAGGARNVIPETAGFAATVRTFSESARDRMQAAVSCLLQGIAAAHGVTAEVKYTSEYPVTVNDADQTCFAEDVIIGLFGKDRHSGLANPYSISEDFSRVLNEVPGSFIGLGATPAGMDPARAPFNHSPFAQYDDAILPDGAQLYAELALRRLARHQQSRSETSPDASITAALNRMHADPERRWTVAELAAVAGLSRSAFARRFTTLTGRPPLAYLSWWRMTLAARLLRETDAPLSSLARQTGYTSEYAFANAFKREYGIAPGKYRTMVAARCDSKPIFTG